MNKTIFTDITKTTAIRAKNRVYNELNTLAGGKADEAIQCVIEFMELDGIVRKIIEQEKEKHS